MTVVLSDDDYKLVPDPFCPGRTCRAWQASVHPIERPAESYKRAEAQQAKAREEAPAKMAEYRKAVAAAYGQPTGGLE